MYDNLLSFTLHGDLNIPSGTLCTQLAAPPSKRLYFLATNNGTGVVLWFLLQNVAGSRRVEHQQLNTSNAVLYLKFGFSGDDAVVGGWRTISSHYHALAYGCVLRDRIAKKLSRASDP